MLGDPGNMPGSYLDYLNKFALKIFQGLGFRVWGQGSSGISSGIWGSPQDGGADIPMTKSTATGPGSVGVIMELRSFSESVHAQADR